MICEKKIVLNYSKSVQLPDIEKISHSSPLCFLIQSIKNNRTEATKMSRILIEIDVHDDIVFFLKKDNKTPHRRMTWKDIGQYKAHISKCIERYGDYWTVERARPRTRNAYAELCDAECIEPLTGKPEPVLKACILYNDLMFSLRESEPDSAFHKLYTEMKLHHEQLWQIVKSHSLTHKSEPKSIVPNTKIAINLHENGDVDVMTKSHTINERAQASLLKGQLIVMKCLQGIHTHFDQFYPRHDPNSIFKLDEFEYLTQGFWLTKETDIMTHCDESYRLTYVDIEIALTNLFYEFRRLRPDLGNVIGNIHQFFNGLKRQRDFEIDEDSIPCKFSKV